MATSQQLSDIPALLNTGANLNIIDFQFAVDNGFMFKPIAQPFCVHNVDGTSNQERMVKYMADALLEFDGHLEVAKFFVMTMPCQPIILG